MNAITTEKKLSRVSGKKALERISSKACTKVSHVCAALLFCFFALMVVFTSSLLAEVNPEHRLKAAFVFNFIQFTDFSSAAGKLSDNYLVCLVGSEDLAEAFASISGKEVEGKSVLLKSIDAESVPHGCSVLFIADSGKNDFERIIERSRGMGILTVGEVNEFCLSGGMIGFYLEKGKIRFEVNIDNLKREGLSLSSKVLRLARIVKD